MYMINNLFLDVCCDFIFYDILSSQYQIAYDLYES